MRGHPSVLAHRENDHPVEITVCSECEKVKTILILSGDRWLCTNPECKASGVARPTQVFIKNPLKR